MPNYSYRCRCGNTFNAFKPMVERHTAECPACGDAAAQTICHTPPNLVDFKYGWFEHIAPEPVYARSKKELRSLCERHNCYATGVD
jgi:putative FmdB family regulatory protein